MEKPQFNGRGTRLVSCAGLVLSLAFFSACASGGEKGGEEGTKTAELTANAGATANEDADMKEVILNVFGMT